MKIRFLAPAWLELVEAASFYETHAAGLGVEFLAVVEDAVRSIGSTPGIGSPYEETTRRLVLPRFPFSLIYDVADETIVIVAVAHQRRRPGYWRERR